MSPVAPGPAATPEAAPLPADAVEVGRVLGAWGVKGGFKVKAYAADPQALFSSKRWYLLPPEVPRPSGVQPPVPPLLRVLQAREHGDAVVATAQEVGDRSAAEALQGARIHVSRASFPTPQDDEFYWVDLIGLAVHDRTDKRLGTVTGLIETGPHCVLRVQAVEPATEELLIPFVAAYVDRVDLPGQRLVVDWQADY